MGLEEYQGMTDSQKLTALCVKMDGIEKRLASLPTCPSAQCGNHETRISTLETYFKIMTGAFVLVLVPLLAALVAILWG